MHGTVWWVDRDRYVWTCNNISWNIGLCWNASLGFLVQLTNIHYYLCMPFDWSWAPPWRDIFLQKHMFCGADLSTSYVYFFYIFWTNFCTVADNPQACPWKWDPHGICPMFRSSPMMLLNVIGYTIYLKTVMGSQCVWIVFCKSSFFKCDFVPRTELPMAQCLAASFFH